MLSGRIKLLKRIRHKISSATAAIIYEMMIRPIMFYCNNIFLNIPEHYEKNYQYIQDRAKIIINDQQITNSWKSIKTLRYQYCAIEVFKCINNIGPDLKADFTKISHKFNTRGNEKKLKLPTVKTESGRKTFRFIGAKIFNSSHITLLMR